MDQEEFDKLKKEVDELKRAAQNEGGKAGSERLASIEKSAKVHSWLVVATWLLALYGLSRTFEHRIEPYMTARSLTLNAPVEEGRDPAWSIDLNAGMISVTDGPAHMFFGILGGQPTVGLEDGKGNNAYLSMRDGKLAIVRDTGKDIVTVKKLE